MSQEQPEFDEVFAKFVSDNYEFLRRCAKTKIKGYSGTYQPTEVLHDAIMRVEQYCKKNGGLEPTPALVIVQMKWLRNTHIRKKRIRGSHSVGGDHVADIESPGVLARDLRSEADIELEAIELDCLQRLLVSHRKEAEVLVFRKYFEMSIEETSEALSVAESTVSNWLRAATALLAACINRSRVDKPSGDGV